MDIYDALYAKWTRRSKNEYAIANSMPKTKPYYAEEILKLLGLGERYSAYIENLPYNILIPLLKKLKEADNSSSNAP